MASWFPRRLLREKSHSWNVVSTAVAGGQTANNVSTVIRSDGGGFWSCAMADVSLSGNGTAKGKDRQKLSGLLWRAVRQICDGGVRAIVVPRNDALFRPWPAGFPQGETILPHSDESMFSDGTGYLQSIIVVSCDAAALRATSLNLTLTQCGALQGGESFSIRHLTANCRLYEIATVAYSDSTHATVTFLPPLREDVAEDTPVEFDRPGCLMRLASTNAMDLTVNPWTFNSASAQFVEAQV